MCSFFSFFFLCADILASAWWELWKRGSPAHPCHPAIMRANLLAETQGESGYCVYCIDWHGCSSGWCPSSSTLLHWLTNNLMRLNTHAHPWLGFTSSWSCSCHSGSTLATFVQRKNPKLLPLRPHKANWEYTSQSSSQIPIKLQHMCTFFFFFFNQDVLFLRILLF